MNYSAEMYTYRVFWSAADSVFVATVGEFPSLSNVADSQIEALSGAIDLVKDVLEDMQSGAEVPPAPFGCKRYSGRYALRMTPEQHRRITMEAAEMGVSVNQLLVSRV